MHKLSLLVAASIGFGSYCPAAESELTLHITTKLGVDASISVDHYWLSVSDRDYNHRRLLSGIDRRSRPKVALQLSDGIYLFFAWEDLKRAVADKGLHTVTLSDGSTYTGQFLTGVRARDGRRFSLHSCKEISVLKARPPKRNDTDRSGLPVDLAIEGVTLPTGEIRFVGFHALRLPTIPGDTTEIRVHNHGEQFEMVVNGENIDGNLSSFERLTISKSDKEAKWIVTVKAPQSAAVKGEFREEFDDHREDLALVFETPSRRKIVVRQPSHAVSVSPRAGAHVQSRRNAPN